MQRALRTAALATLLLGGASAAQAVGFTTTYSENFNTLASTGATGTALPAGWTFVETSTNADSAYSVGTGSSNAGDTYSFGAASAADRAFGTLRSGNLISTIFADFQNLNATTVTSLTVAYAGEEWRLGTTGRADRLDFAYSINGGAFIDFDALDFSSPVTTGATGALDGNLAANRTVINATLAGINLGAGGTIRFRWTDLDATGADDGLAIDDFSLTPTFAAAVPEPATWAMMIGGFGLVGGALRRRKAATLAAA